jgi:hypothetical protein
MSHSRSQFLPSFNLTVQEAPPQFRYDAAAQQTGNTIQQQQWLQQRARSVQLNVPSPVPSVRSAVTSPSYQRSFDRSPFQEQNVSSVNNKHDTDLLGMNLLGPSGHVERDSYSPMTRNYNEEAWNTFNLRTSGASDNSSPFNQSSASLKPFRHGPGSICSPAPRSDSGFYSQSIVSHDANRMEQPGMQWNPSPQLNNLNVLSIASDAPPMARVASEQRSQYSRASSHSGYQGESLTCPKCGEKSKCKSDHKCVASSVLYINC